MDFKKELGKKNREKFISDVKRLLDIDLNYEYDKYLDKNPYRIYIEIKPEFMNSFIDYCINKGYHIEYHLQDYAWITFDYEKMIKWYNDFNSDYHYNLYHFYHDGKEV